MSKPILRVAKMKRYGPTCPQAVDNHLSRSVETHNADPARTGANVWIVGGPGQLVERINQVLDVAHINTADLRKDATISNDILLTISPDFFRKDPDAAGTWQADKLEIFQREATAFLKQQFGPRLVAAVLHLDESTPHIQAVVVPVVKTPKGLRLSGKSYFDPARLTALQDAWETRLKPHGVDPRLKGSTARHTTIKTYYSGLQEAPRVPKALPPSPPPLRALLPGGGEVLAHWQAEELAKVKKREKPLAKAVAKGMLYDAERTSAETMRGQMRTQAARFSSIRDELANASADLALSKERIAALRATPINEVAAALEFTGDIGKRENAIDLVKRVGNLTFEEATRWLSIAFSPAAAGAAVHQHAATTYVDVDNPVLSSADQVKAKAITQQLNALGSLSYRITAMHKRDDGSKYGVNLCKVGDEERLWSASEVIAQIPRLTAENARGGNVFVTPVDHFAHYVLMDDLDGDGLQTMKTAGYKFTTVVETSPNNHQAVLKVAKNLPEAAVNEFFKAQNREVGDEKITGLVHPMRLAGFQNRKAKYEQVDTGHFPFVRLLEASRAFCAHTKAVIMGIAEQMKHHQRSGAKPFP